MPPPSFEERATSGRYDQLAQIFNEGSDSLAAVSYGTDFTGHSTAWRNADVRNYRTTFLVLGQTSEDDTADELVVNIIGEVAREGSELTACGNHTWMKPGQKIVDTTSVRDVLVLVLPTMATESLAILYENQICTIKDMEEKVSLPVPKVCAISFAYLLLFTPSHRP